MEKDNKTIANIYTSAFKEKGVVYNCIKIIGGGFPYITSGSFFPDEVDLETRRTEQIAELRKEAAEWWRVLGFGNTFFTEPLLGDDSKSSLISEIDNEIELHSFTDKYVARCIKKILTPLKPLFDIYVGVVTNKKIRPLLDVNISDIDLDEIIVEGGYYFGFEHKKDFTPEDFIVTTWYELLNFIEELDTLLTECDFDLVEIAKSSNITLHLPHRNAQPAESRGKRGRHKKPFAECIICADNKKSEVMELLHHLIDGTKGRHVALVITAATDAGAITKPNSTQVREEFGNIGNISGYNSLMKLGFTKSELDPIIEKFKAIMTS